MNWLQMPRPLAWLLVLSTLGLLLQPSRELIACKTDLMKSFYLQGIRISIVEKMHVCPFVHDKCCTLADEVKITHLWNKHTGPIVERYTEDVIANLNSTMRHFFRLVKLDPDLIMLKYSVPKQVPFKYKHCYTMSRLRQTARDRRVIKEYKDGYLKFVNKRLWKYKNRPKPRKRPPLGGYYREPVHLFKTETHCNVRVDSFYRDFIVVNQEKLEHCIGIHDKFMDFRVKDFITLLPNVKNSLNFVAGLKRKFYCDLCDAHSHQFFDLKEKQFVVSQQFCNSLLRQKIDYFKFMHIVWVEFANELLQYQACFETDGRVFDFPFQTFLVKYLRRVPLVKKCLGSLDDKKNFYKNCWMICELYRYDSFSPFFDGEVEMLRRVNVSLFSFIRKLMRAESMENKREKKAVAFFSISKKERTAKLIQELMLPENVDGTLIEPLNPTHMMTGGRFYLGKEDRLRLFGADSTEQFSVGYRTNEAIKFNKLNTSFITAGPKKKMKLMKEKARIKQLRKKGKWIPPKKKKFKLPYKKPIITGAGMIDRLSTRRFKEHLKPGLYPQRSLFLTRASELDATDIADKLDISDEEKNELVKSYGLVAPKPRELMLSVDDGVSYYKSDPMQQMRRKLIRKKGGRPKRRRGGKKKRRKKTPEEILNPLVKSSERTREQRRKVGQNTIREDDKVRREKVKDRKSWKLKKSEFKDFYSKKNEKFPGRKTKKKKVFYPEVLKVEDLNQIFEKVEAKVDTRDFVHVFEKKGLNPLHNVELMNFRYNITRLIEMRYKLPEKIAFETVKQYMSVDKDYLKGFNKDIERDVDVYEDVNEIMSEVNRLNQFRKKIMRGDQDPVLLGKITREMNRLQKIAKENAARRSAVKKEMKRRRNRKGHSDLNHNKYPFYHHHHDLYYNDTFHGIEEMFSHIFGS